MDLIQKYFPNLSAEQMLQFEALPELYQNWNNQINVISRKNIEELETQHILHSLAIPKWMDFKPRSKILDVGTGGGFPGIPLAIMFPETEFHLVDSIGKKIKVVQAVADEIGLQNVKSFHERAEKMPDKYDFVITRAVAPMASLKNWSKGKIKENGIHEKPNGIIALKGGDLKDELQPFQKKVELQSISDYFSEPFFDTKKIVYLPL